MAVDFFEGRAGESAEDPAGFFADPGGVVDGFASELFRGLLAGWGSGRGLVLTCRGRDENQEVNPARHDHESLIFRDTPPGLRHSLSPRSDHF